MSSTFASIPLTKSSAKQKDDDEQPEEMELFGNNGMGYERAEELDFGNGNTYVDDFIRERNNILGLDETHIYYAGRPTNFINRMEKQNTAYWRFYLLMDYYAQEVSILATILSRSVIELLRYGIEWQPRFVCKCTECGQEYQETIKICDVCGSNLMIKPDEQQKDYFIKPGTNKSFIREANDSLQSLKSVIQSYAEMQYRYNQGYILCVTGDVLEDGKVDRRPLEFVAQNPQFVKKMLDDSAVPGTEVGFTIDDRQTPLPLNKYITQEDERGMRIYPAFYRIGDSYGATGAVWHYTKDEVFCDNWFGQTLTYGVPIWMSIEDDVLTYHFIEKHQLKRWQYGYVRGLLVMPGFNEESLKKLAKSVQAVLRKNDNSIPMIATPQPVANGGDQKVQFVQLSSDTASDMLSYKNDIRDRLCGHAGVPNLIVTDTENSGGLNSESQQITVFDRFLMDKYDRIDDLLEWIISLFPKITDWKLVVGRPPKMDSDMKDKMEQAQYADMMVNRLKFGITSYRNGKFEFTDKPLTQPADSESGGGFGGGGGSFR